MSLTKRVLLPLCLAFVLLLSACGGGGKEATVSTPTPAPASMPALAVRQYDSSTNGVAFEYPAGWTVQETGRTFTIAPAAGADCGTIIADITKEVELFLAGYGDLISSIKALMERHANLFAMGAELQHYQSSAFSAGGEVAGNADFFFEGGDGTVYTCTMEVVQTGSRVLLTLFGRGGGTAEKNAELDGLYSGLVNSIRLADTEGELAPADLTALGFPAAKAGRFAYYNPITGQFMTIPEECDVSSGPYDAQVVIYSGDHGLMIVSNWTEPFDEMYNSTNGDLTQCFAAFLEECLAAAQDVFGQKLLYRDLKYQPGGNNGELIKANFYVDPDGVSTRCFAELAARGDFVQGTFLIYNPDNMEAARALFNGILDTSLIAFPDLG